jgi:hypothetical protein
MIESLPGSFLLLLLFPHFSSMRGSLRHEHAYPLLPPYRQVVLEILNDAFSRLNDCQESLEASSKVLVNQKHISYSSFLYSLLFPCFPFAQVPEDVAQLRHVKNHHTASSNLPHLIVPFSTSLGSALPGNASCDGALRAAPAYVRSSRKGRQGGHRPAPGHRRRAARR